MDASSFPFPLASGFDPSMDGADDASNSVAGGDVARMAGRRRKQRVPKRADAGVDAEAFDKFKKTVMCRYLPRCRKGRDCPFAHAERELRSRPDLSKTRMCAGYFDGRCKLSSNECPFAHGDHELRMALLNSGGAECSIGGEVTVAAEQVVAAMPLVSLSPIMSPMPSSAAMYAAAPMLPQAAVSPSTVPHVLMLPSGAVGGPPFGPNTASNRGVKASDFASNSETQFTSASGSNGGSGASTPTGAYDVASSASGREDSPIVAPSTMPGGMQPLMAQWLDNIRIMTNSSGGRLPSPQLFERALLQAMPETYED